MCDALQGPLPGYGDMKKTKREKWISYWAGQLTSLGAGSWTGRCTKALRDLEGQQGRDEAGEEEAGVAAQQAVRHGARQPDKLDRKKVVNIVTVEVHSRDVIDRMVKPAARRSTTSSGCSSCATGRRAARSAASCARPTRSDLYGYEYSATRRGSSSRRSPTAATTTLTTALHLRLRAQRHRQD